MVTVRTDRSTNRLLTAGGDLVAEIAHDRVTAVAPGPGSATLSQWREVEAELGPAGSEELLNILDARLVDPGAHSAGMDFEMDSSSQFSDRLGLLTGELDDSPTATWQASTRDSSTTRATIGSEVRLT